MNISGTNSILNRGTFARTPFMPLEPEAIEGFAYEITRRAALAPAPENRTTSDEALEKSISDAVSFVEDNFGDRAARTFMGVVLKNAASKPLSEDELGNALVDGLEFIDRAFGIAAGDKAMGFFNGELNQAINGYFQNGKNESFLAMDLDEASDKLGDAMGQAVSAMMDKFQAKSVDPNALLMDQAKKDQEDTLDSQGEPGDEYLEDETGETGQAVDENGMPVTDAALTGEPPVSDGEAATDAAVADAAATSASGEVQTQEHAARKAQAGTKRRMRAGRKTRRNRQEASSAASAYDQSGIRPGVVLDKKI